MRYVIRFIIITILFSTTLVSQWFDEISIKSIVHIEKMDSGQYLPHGTGFLLEVYQDVTKAILITCGHVLKKPELYVTINPDSSYLAWAKQKIQRQHITLDSVDWNIEDNKLRTKIIVNNTPHIIHDKLDIAALYIDIPNFIFITNKSDSIIGAVRHDSSLKRLDLNFIKSYKVCQKNYIPQSKHLYKNNVNLGDDIFFVGFPFGVGTINALEPVVRSGIVAWKSNYSSEFLLDALSFGGNSGSAVFTKKSNTRETKLIGMVIGHLDTLLYRNNEIQNKSFVNAGLVRCVWIDDIEELVYKLIQKLEQESKKK